MDGLVLSNFIKFDELILARFKSYVRHNYYNCSINNAVICCNIQCSKTYLHKLINREYNCSTMRYIEYFRILKAIEFIFEKEKEVFADVGYKSSSVFSRAFLRVTGFNARLFYSPQLKEHQHIIQAAISLAAENPRVAIKFIINNSSIRSILLEKKSNYKHNKETNIEQKDCEEMGIGKQEDYNETSMIQQESRNEEDAEQQEI